MCWSRVSRSMAQPLRPSAARALRFSWAGLDPGLQCAAPGEFPSGQRGPAVNRLAPPSEVRILPPPFEAGAAECDAPAVSLHRTAQRVANRLREAGLDVQVHELPDATRTA